MSRVDIPPWLSHLRTDRRGLPVPWVNRWGPEVQLACSRGWVDGPCEAESRRVMPAIWGEIILIGRGLS